MQTATRGSKTWLWLLIAAVAVAVVIGAFVLYHGGGSSSGGLY